jgi:hypothetical protein
MANAPEQPARVATMSAKGNLITAAATKEQAAEAGRSLWSKGSEEDGGGLDRRSVTQRIGADFGARPECFKNTFQEV